MKTGVMVHYCAILIASNMHQDATMIPASQSLNALARFRLDQRLDPIRDNVGALAMPRGGWLKAIRSALGMSLADAATRLGVAASTMLRIEASEARGRIQLDSLQRAADALGCDLHYVLVPRKPLAQQVDAAATEQADRIMKRAQMHMALEDQAQEPDAASIARRKALAGRISERELWKSK